MARRKYVKPVDPAVYDDPRLGVNIIYINGIGYLDHHEAAIAWDDYNAVHPLTRKESVSIND